MKQPSAPASIVGTAKPFSGEITEALVKSHRLLVDHFFFLFPFKMEGGGLGLEGIRSKIGCGNEKKKKVKGPREGWMSRVMWSNAYH